MDKIKGKGLSALIKEGQFNFRGADVEVYNCLSEDLSTEEIDASINLCEDILPKLPNAIKKLKEMEDNYEEIGGKEESTHEEEYESVFEDGNTQNFKQSRSSVSIILGVAFIIFGGLLVTPKYLGLSSPAANTCMIWGLLCVVPGVLFLILSSHGTSSQDLEPSKDEERTEEIEHDFVENEQQRRIQEDRRALCNQIGLIPENNCLLYDGFKIEAKWHVSAQMLSERLPLLLAQLKRIKVVHQDNSLSPSAKMLAIAQLFSLMNNEIVNAKMLTEKRKQSQTMEQQLKEMKKHSRELEVQNDMLTLQTYNKISEMEGHDPNIVAAQTYAQMSRIQDERKKED